MSVVVRKGHFKSSSETLVYTEFVPAKTNRRLLALHGAGKAIGKRMLYLGEKLAETGIGFSASIFRGMARVLEA